MNGQVTEERLTWFEKIISSLLSSSDDGSPVTYPEEMIHKAAQRAFKISTALGLVPGPIGMVTILPEVAALAKLQINLVYRIARYHHKQKTVNREIILLIFGNVMGVGVGEMLARRVGTKLIVKSVNASVIRGVAKRIGSQIIDRAAERAVGRWLPMLLAPLFGYFSRSMTKKIGREADRLFSGQIELEAPVGES